MRGKRQVRSRQRRPEIILGTVDRVIFNYARDFLERGIEDAHRQTAAVNYLRLLCFESYEVIDTDNMPERDVRATQKAFIVAFERHSLLSTDVPGIHEDFFRRETHR